MDFQKIQRRATHLFFIASLSLFFVTPVFAVTADIVSVDPAANIMPVTKPVALTTPKPKEPDHVALESKTPAEVAETPTNTPTPSPIATPSAKIATPTPSPTALPTPAPAAVTAQTGSNTSTGGLNADILFDMSNNHRAGKGLASFQKDERICSLAAARAPQIAAEISGGYMHAGMNSHNFPYRFTENIVTMRTEAEAFNFWLNDGRADDIHQVQIEAPNTHSCVACNGNACTQLFTSFQPK